MEQRKKERRRITFLDTYLDTYGVFDEFNVGRMIYIGDTDGGWCTCTHGTMQSARGKSSNCYHIKIARAKKEILLNS